MQGGARKLAGWAVLLCACFISAATAGPQLHESSNLDLGQPEPWLGGLSGIEVSDDGSSAMLITDRGRLFAARLERQGGEIRAARIGTPQRLTDAAGALRRGHAADSEGLAISAQGRVYISVEDAVSVLMVDPATGRSEVLPQHPDFARFSQNRGLEALAIDAEGSLFALAEHSRRSGPTTPLYRFDGTDWQIAYHLPLSGGFVPVGADFGPDGRLYLLERAVTPLGFSSRIRRITLAEASPKIEKLLTTLPGAFDNLEGISVWRDTLGQIRLTMVSDDNFFALQHSQIVEFTLTE